MPLSIKADIRVIIIGDSRAESCSANCGLDWSSAEVVRQARQQARARFGGRVRVEYLDLSRPTGKAPQLPEAARLDLPLPRLLINGALRISGQFDVGMLLNAIDTEIEIKQY